MGFYKKYPVFDWEYYINIYPDLQKAQINTEEKAILHYLNFGIKENRKTHKIKIQSKIQPISFTNFISLSKQLYVSDGLIMFKKRFKKKFNLNDYNNLNLPSLFFGCYTTKDLETLSNHNDLKILIWGGEDCNPEHKHSKDTLDQIKNITNIIHLSISKQINKSLKKANILSILVNFNLVDKTLFYPVPKNELGKSIFIFNGQDNGREHIYGSTHYKQIIKLLQQYTFIFSNQLNSQWEDMPNIYKKCFIMLRLTSHDGNANSVQECEAMNIPVIHNQSDYGLKWETVEDIITHINNNKLSYLN